MLTGEDTCRVRIMDGGLERKRQAIADSQESVELWVLIMSKRDGWRFSQLIKEYSAATFFRAIGSVTVGIFFVSAACAIQDSSGATSVTW